MANLTVKAGADHLASVASAKPVAALSEIIWNGFDAKSSSVSVVMHQDPVFKSINSIQIIDAGSGIPHEKVAEYFGNLGESWKKNQKANGDRSLHGQYGRGRFKALSLGSDVKWHTVYEQGGEYFEYFISINANNIKDFYLSDPAISKSISTGTTVEIGNLINEQGELLSDNALIDLTKEFALFLTEYPSRKLIFNSRAISPEEAWDSKSDYELGDFELTNGIKTNLSLTVIEWKRKVNRELHYCDTFGFTLFKEKTGNIIRAPGYDFSIYAKSNLFKVLNEKNTLALGDLIPEVKELKEIVIQRVRTHFLDKQFLEKTKIVEDWKRQEIYPYSDSTPQTPVDLAERKLFDILAVNVQSYLKNFEGADKKTKKFTFALLSQALKENPKSVQKIINEVLGLKKKEQDDLANLLYKTTLSSIITASKIISDRIDFLKALDNLVHEKETKNSLLERDQLHKILEREAWIFREDFYLAGSENWLEDVLSKHIKHLGKRLDEEEDFISEAPVFVSEGKRGRVDLMFAKSRQPSEGYTEYLVIELKRPSQKIDLDVINQVEKYAMAVSSDERFDHSKSKWTFIAVSNSMDKYAEQKASQRGWPKGKTYDGAEFNVEVWAMTWAELINSARARLSFFSKQLKYEATKDSATEYLERTHKEYIPSLDSMHENV
ncbi:ATP-binding protein [Pectobacterium parmentieri]|uniref:ATP-binding protein n=1 Tax=Pectobacterium parmentieri TaxID=1905730 RepID=UPI0018E1C1B7|nr:ATP-binding protein [Pectobacterium parmentieri]QQA74751.1 ATP-binding protein [Pectobacterium parmentieri]